MASSTTSSSASAAPTSSTSGDEPVTADNAPVSFGVFNPQGKVVVGVPSRQQSDDLVKALGDAGWAGDAVVPFMPPGTEGDLAQMAETASPMSDFGYERTLLHRYRDLSRRGFHWLLVTVKDLEHAQELARLAREQGAEVAVYYRRLTTEDLIEPPVH